MSGTEILRVEMHHRFADREAFLQACHALGWTKIADSVPPPDNIEIVTPWNVALEPIGAIEDQEPGYYVAAEWAGALPESFAAAAIYLPNAPQLSPSLSKRTEGAPVEAITTAAANGAIAPEVFEESPSDPAGPA